jgi:hypothetical protein
LRNLLRSLNELLNSGLWAAVAGEIFSPWSISFPLRLCIENPAPSGRPKRVCSVKPAIRNRADDVNRERGSDSPRPHTRRKILR